jgi:hypothetical protein
MNRNPGKMIRVSVLLIRKDYRNLYPSKVYTVLLHPAGCKTKGMNPETF